MSKAKMSDFFNLRLFGALILSVLLFCVGSVSAQYKGEPVQKDGLLQVLRSKQFQAREIVRIINDNGVDFKLNGSVENELVGAGARPAIIEAVRSNYRNESKQAVNAPIKGNINNSPGRRFESNDAPLTKETVIALLKTGTNSAKLQQDVKTRGVNFQMTPQNSAEIKKAGGSDTLIGVMFVSYRASNSVAVNNPVNNAPKTANNSSYDGLITQAVEVYDKRKDWIGALNLLKRAVTMNPANSRAYQLLGYINLYGLKNYTEAERYMNESLKRGGSAVFRVIHDHDGIFRNTCEGSLYVARDSVRFESDDNKHTFDTPDTNIKEVKMNSSLRRMFQTKSDSYKIVLRVGDDDGKKFSFAPLTGSDSESKMVIRLIGKN